MSTHIASDVWKYSQAHGAALLVLVSLADQANDAGECWPSVESIAARCRVSVRSVHRYLDQLLSLGELEKTERPGRSSAYVVHPLGDGPRPATPANLTHPVDSAATSANLADPSANLTEAPANLTHPTPANLADGSATAGRQNHHSTRRTNNTSSSPTADAAGDQTNENPPETPPAPPGKPDEPPRDDVDRICTHLADRIAANGSRRPTITADWRRQARLLLDRDQRTEAQVHTAIDWCQDDPFWHSNVMSMPKLRERYDTLRLKAQAQRDEQTRKTGDDPDARARRERARRIASVPDPIPPADLSPVDAITWTRRARQRIADDVDAAMRAEADLVTR